MKRFRRWLFHLTAWFSLTVLVGGIATTFFGHANFHHLARCRIEQHQYILDEFHGSLYCTRALTGDYSLDYHNDLSSFVIGIRHTSTYWHATTIAVPYFFLSLIFCIYPSFRFEKFCARLLEDRGSRKMGLCQKCGYDLRATPDRCPECGNAVPRPENSK